MLDRVRKIYKNFPQISVPQQLEDDDDMQKLSEALGAAKTRVEVCSSFLKAAMKWAVLSLFSMLNKFFMVLHTERKTHIILYYHSLYFVSFVQVILLSVSCKI